MGREVDDIGFCVVMTESGTYSGLDDRYSATTGTCDVFKRIFSASSEQCPVSNSDELQVAHGNLGGSARSMHVVCSTSAR